MNRPILRRQNSMKWLYAINFNPLKAKFKKIKKEVEIEQRKRSLFLIVRN